MTPMQLKEKFTETKQRFFRGEVPIEQLHKDVDAYIFSVKEWAKSNKKKAPRLSRASLLR